MIGIAVHNINVHHVHNKLGKLYILAIKLSVPTDVIIHILAVHMTFYIHKKSRDIKSDDQ